MKATAVFGFVAVMIVAIGSLAGCGGSSSQKATSQKASTHKPTVQRVQLTEDDIPDVLMPGIWTGIKGAYREGNRVEIYTTWSDTPEHRLNAEGAAMAAAGDLEWYFLHDHYVTVYGDWDDVLGSWGSS